MCDHLRGEVDDLICLATPGPFYGVGQFYYDFSQVSDQEVSELLDRAAREVERTKTRVSLGDGSTISVTVEAGLPKLIALIDLKRQMMGGHVAECRGIGVLQLLGRHF